MAAVKAEPEWDYTYDSSEEAVEGSKCACCTVAPKKSGKSYCNECSAFRTMFGTAKDEMESQGIAVNASIDRAMCAVHERGRNSAFIRSMVQGGHRVTGKNAVKSAICGLLHDLGEPVIRRQSDEGQSDEGPPDEGPPVKKRSLSELHAPVPAAPGTPAAAQGAPVPVAAAQGTPVVAAQGALVPAAQGAPDNIVLRAYSALRAESLLRMSLSQSGEAMLRDEIAKYLQRLRDLYVRTPTTVVQKAIADTEKDLEAKTAAAGALEEAVASELADAVKASDDHIASLETQLYYCKQLRSSMRPAQ